MANYADVTHQTSVRTSRKRGRVGQLAHTSSGGRNHIDTFINADPQRRWSRTLTVDSFNAGDVYDITINGRRVAYTAVSGDTDASGVAAKLKTAIESDPVAGGVVTVTRVGAVLTLTGRWPGFDVDVSKASARETLGAATAALTATPVPFGRVLFAGSAAAKAGNKRAKLPAAADLSLASHALTPVVANSTAYSVDVISPEGTKYTSAPYTSDVSATPKEIVDNVNLAIAALSAFIAAGGAVADDDAVLTVTLPDGWTLNASGALWGNVRTAPVNADAKFVGVAVFSHTVAPDVFEGGDADGYGPNSTMDVLTGNGEIWVEVDAATAPSDPVYVELAGDDAGKLYKTSTATRARLRRLRWYEDNDGADGIAIVRVLDASQPDA